MYLALYRKYRPSTFDDVISQEHITTTLKNQIATGQIAHAYLFTGTRGTGKTTCAKIMAKAVNCLSPVNGNPCGKCDSCRAIADGSTDIIEIDAASNNGVDSIRQIRDEVIYTPIDCKYKVYIIDEAHQLSDAAKNALLKTLEEPPAHAIFILATTEYYSVRATIISRCQQFMFSKIDPQQSAKRLLEVAEKENVSLTPAAAALIARLSDGAMRDALSLLDQCVSADRNVTEELVRRISGVADSGWLFGISQAAIDKTPAAALKILDTLITQGKDLNRFIEELTLHLRNLMLTKAVSGSGLVSAGEDELKEYEKQCKSCSADEIMRWVELVSESLDKVNRMKQTGQARLLAESLLIRLCTPKLDNDTASLAARLGALEHKIDSLKFSDIKEKSEPEREQAVKVEPAPQAVQEPDRRSEPPADFDRPQEQDIPFDPPYSDISAADQAAEYTEEQRLEISQPDEPVEPPSEIAQPFPEPSPELSIEEILQPFDDDTDKPEVSEPDSYELPPPPEPLEGQTFFVEPPQQLDTPLLDEPDIDVDRIERERNEEMLKASQSKEVQPEREEEALVKAAEEKLLEEEPRPIQETDEVLPKTAQPLPQWSDIVSEQSTATRNLLASTQAFLWDGRIFIQAPPSARKILEKSARAEKLRDSAKSVLGGRFELFLLKEQPPEEEEKEDLVTPFLQRARDMGIDVTINDR